MLSSFEKKHFLPHYNGHYANLKEKIKKKKVIVGIIGLGYVGLPLALEILEAGFQVYGFEVSNKKIKMLNSGKSYINGISNDRIKKFIQKDIFFPRSDFKLIKECDVISICVPTPLKLTKDPDISMILKVISKIKTHMKKEILIILESTVYPGFTVENIQNEIEKIGHKIDEDFFICFSPERVDPGNDLHNIGNIPKVLGGSTLPSTTLGCLFYKKIFKNVISVSSTQTAEMVKLLENTFRYVNIGLINEIAILCEYMRIDIWEVLEAASTKPFGFMAFYPGPGIGGHCIPVDPNYLLWKAKEHGFCNKFIELANYINGNMPRYIIQKIVEALNIKKCSLKGSRILLLGLAYKKDIDDIRESPALNIYSLLCENGAIVDYHDPFVPSVTFTTGEKKSVEIDFEELKFYDCVVLITDHSCFNYEKIAESSNIIVDTRNGFKSYKKNIIKLGVATKKEQK